MRTIDTSDIFTIGVAIFGFTVAQYSEWMGAIALTLTAIWVLNQIIWRLKNWGG
ncbi:MAG: hypothetical protein GDA51_08950 [Ekhidna sp.]|nr:hypothetical protein [Ekhidna sp.]MBC6426574.1 hypothetical protein [Ekhidna sp.]